MITTNLVRFTTANVPGATAEQLTEMNRAHLVACRRIGVLSNETADPNGKFPVNREPSMADILATKILSAATV